MLTFYFISVCKFSHQGQDLKTNPKGKHSALLLRRALKTDHICLDSSSPGPTMQVTERHSSCVQHKQTNKTSLNSLLSTIPADTSTMAQCQRTKHLARHLTGFSNHTLRRYTPPLEAWKYSLVILPSLLGLQRACFTNDTFHFWVEVLRDSISCFLS